MQIRAFVQSSRQRVIEAGKGVVRFAKLERVLATVCCFIPLLLIACDDREIRDSISAYYNMAQNQVFYFPLTVASMLFIVNGVVKDKRSYNWVLGAMLAGVILFNHEDFPLTHGICACLFFGGNGYVILRYSSKRERWFMATLVGIIVVSMLGCFVFNWITLFFAEWISFAIIATHYIIESRRDSLPASEPYRGGDIAATPR